MWTLEDQSEYDKAIEEIRKGKELLSKKKRALKAASNKISSSKGKYPSNQQPKKKKRK